MEERWRKLWVGGGKVEVTCGGRYGGKSGGVWQEKYQVLTSDYLTKRQF